MKPLLIEALRSEPDDFRRRNKVREYLQARILQSLQDYGAFTNWAFLGGTALRFLFNLPRYSEDLDFSLVSHKSETRFAELLSRVQSDLRGEAYDTHVITRDQSSVKSALFKFRGLLHELGLSPHREEVLSVKVEIDTNPPSGAITETHIVRRFVMLNLLHHDRSTLLAGKLNAIMTRKYTKGRDLYDLAWYLADPDWPLPNFLQLNNALGQTGWEGSEVTQDNWRLMVKRKLETIDWTQALQDVSPFLERKQDTAFISKETLFRLLTDEGDMPT
ncbi:MAG: nucleotidyl transferase AbiEii/AbiGii toxin family protein [Spirochaetales bacterium]|jgi:predicted nucleotidyltransferase component of viral defense system|nr:nucleotidyl transferase AbiEii/AbiGii toxin family protein [Spirochaetales bacterium]